MYSTALPLPVVSAASAALRVSQREWWRRHHLWSLVTRLGEGLGVPALSPVVPLVVGPEAATLQLSSTLLRAGLHVPAIRPPTVPAGTCRCVCAWLHCTIFLLLACRHVIGMLYPTSRMRSLCMLGGSRPLWLWRA